MSLQFIFFIILGALAIASALFTVINKNPVASAMSLVVHFFMLAGLYLTLQAQFLAVIQVLVYAGAIMVLVIFVIMLLNLGDEKAMKEKFNFRKALAVVFALLLVFQLVVVYFTQTGFYDSMPAEAVHNGTAQAIGAELYTNYLFAFEAIAILLLLAIVGAMLLAKRRID